MSSLVVKPVESRAERKQFVAFPWTLYRGDPNWIPPLLVDIKERLNYRPHPFYEHNAIQTFLAYRSGEVCGRIAAIHNQAHLDRYADGRGFFGFFECVDDQEAARALLNAARQWLGARGLKQLRGPMNPALTYELGTLIEGFDSPPTFMMPYNPPYYQRLLENEGLRKAQDLYSYWGHLDMLPQVAVKLRPISEQIVERCNITLRPLDKKHFLRDVESFLDVFNRSLTTHWGFVPMSQAEVRHMARGLRYLMIPELSLAAEIDGRIVGTVFGMPDYNPRIKQINGRLFPFGFIRLLRNKRAIKRIRLVSTNVLPEYQLQGVGLVLMYGMVPRGLALGMDEAEFSWVAESNSLSRGSLEKGGAKRVKTFRVYDGE